MDLAIVELPRIEPASNRPVARVVPVLFAPEALERMAYDLGCTVTWGKPDYYGCYTPTFTRTDSLHELPGSRRPEANSGETTAPASGVTSEVEV
jgi:hypothetical protein